MHCYIRVDKDMLNLYGPCLKRSSAVWSLHSLTLGGKNVELLAGFFCNTMINNIDIMQIYRKLTISQGEKIQRPTGFREESDHRVDTAVAVQFCHPPLTGDIFRFRIIVSFRDGAINSVISTSYTRKMH